MLAWRTLQDSGAGFVAAVLVLSHVALDMISGNKPLWAGGPMGLGAERFEQLELCIESGLFLAGWALMRRTSRLRWATRRVSAAALVLLEATYLAGSMSARPYKTRCLAYPIAPCTERSLLTTRWRVRPFFFVNIA